MAGFQIKGQPVTTEGKEIRLREVKNLPGANQPGETGQYSGVLRDAMIGSNRDPNLTVPMPLSGRQCSHAPLWQTVVQIFFLSYLATEIPCYF